MTEDQTTWKGHTFTLLVFAGIVVLCSIFFILGMLVGRQQGQKYASVASAAAKNEAKETPKDDKQDFTFYDSVKREDDAALRPAAPPRVDPDPEPQPDPPAPTRAEPVKKPEPAPKRAPVPEAASGPSPAPSNVINFQVGAVRKASDAKKLLDDLKKKGFRALILDPAKGDSNPLYRVQVGPFADVVEAESVKKKLEKEKYQVYSKK
jgi:cell division septation protein DedD